MKILHIIDHLGIGGAQNILLDLLETRAANIDASICSLKNQVLPLAHKRIEATGATYQTLNITNFNPIGWLKLRSIIKKGAFDVVHTHLYYSSMLGIAAAVSLGRSRPLLVDHIHSDPLNNYSAWQRYSNKIVASKVGVHIAVSSSLRKAIQSAYKKRAASVRAIPPGINLDVFQNRNIDSTRVNYFRGGASRVVGMIGRLAKVKAVHVLLQATPAILKDDPGTRVLIVGDGPLRQNLMGQADKLGIGDAVFFAGYQSDVVSAYQAMDVFVQPSQTESFGLAVIEAMAVGVPVVVSNVGGMMDTVKDGETGLIVPFGNTSALSDAILRLFRQPSLRKRLIDNSSRFVQQNFSRNRMTAEIESIYEKLKKDKQNKLMSNPY